MTKYQQALVRADIKALICAPIKSEGWAMLGVLSLDPPDHEMLEHFQSQEVEAFMWNAALSIAKVLAMGAVGNQE